MAKPQTIVISNFTGRLTRMVNGSLNSGFAKFDTSYGYDPFVKPMNLTWAAAPTNINGTTNQLILDGGVRFAGETNPMFYGIAQTGKLIKIQISDQATENPSLNSVIAVHSVLAGAPTYTKGASMEFFGNEQKIYVGSDVQVNSINFDGSADTAVGNDANYQPNIFRPLRKFAGKLYFNNKRTVGAIDGTGTVTSSLIGVSSLVALYSELNPPLPNPIAIKDMDVSPDNNYLMFATAENDYENIANGTAPNTVNSTPAKSAVLQWNGIDGTVTAGTSLSTTLVTALQTYLQHNHYFGSDSQGALLANDTQKILTLKDNKAPFPNAIGVNGNFLHWVAPERTTIAGTPKNVATMYYFGSLDQENPPGLWRMFRRTAADFAGGNVLQTPFNDLVSVQYSDLNQSQSSVVTQSVGTHYFSMYQVGQGAGAGSMLSLWRWNNPSYTSDSIQTGVYETQTQLFEKRIHVEQIRVYTEPTTTSNSFQIDIIGQDGTPIDNGTFTYTYAAGSDLTQLQGPMERINFNPNADAGYGFGIRITNLGTANWTLKKLEVDVGAEGR